ncbi:substrate-binding protein [Desulfosarcina ovata]|uniref:ABC transporter substrate-binding protein n=1 Tax=Desulfosarcina ovata subsp. ovata TaxID=2752305 RepID=A0A5K8AKL6_9BACT|nr:substrate-binding protein [Desulfosarcina ovata]BBO93039.1 ABC transporter substrate-binding protein [Desulfosarcina ovata subsp. ovata]
MKNNRLSMTFALVLLLMQTLTVLAQDDPVKIGLNYSKTGPYAKQGLDQWRASQLAVNEINTCGGILGRPVEIVVRDSKSQVDLTIRNVNHLIDVEKVKMVFGGSASSVAIAAGKICQDKGILFFGTLTYSTETTGKEAKRHVFRECYNSWMGAKAIASFLNKKYAGKKYFYLTANYTWGVTTEQSVRRFSRTEDRSVHKGVLTPFPNATEKDFKRALAFAKIVKPDVLVLVLFGNDMSTAIRIATALGLKKNIQMVVPNLTLGMAEGAGPKVMEGVIGALPWTWKVPYKYDYREGRRFVEAFTHRYNRYPSTSGASAYTILWQYKEAVERAGTFDTPAVIRALEGHAYVLLKDRQYWRSFDHQSVQTVYAVRCNPQVIVLRDKFKLDYFEILASLSGEEAVRSHHQWEAVRRSAGKPVRLEPLPDE